MRILVVDDDACLARSIQRRLKSCQVAVELDATNALTRVVAAELAGEPFDVVLCDLRMPVMNGIVVLTGLRTRAAPPLLILMSGIDCALDLVQVADAVLCKPFCTDDLLEGIERARAMRATTQTRRLRRMTSATSEHQVSG
jgi:DNA-binding response OmpR family regulator